MVSWKDEREPSRKHSIGRKIVVVLNSPEYRTLDKIDGEPMELEWNIFPGFTTSQLSNKVQELLLRLGETLENLQDGSSSCQCSTTSHGDLKTTRKNASQMLNSFLYLQKDSEQDNGHSSHLDERNSGILLVKIVHKVNGTIWRKRWW